MKKKQAVCESMNIKKILFAMFLRGTWLHWTISFVPYLEHMTLTQCVNAAGYHMFLPHGLNSCCLDHEEETCHQQDPAGH